METPHPYSQRKLRDGTILREFRSDARSEELVWHQDREHRTVRVIESGGWMLQLEEGLPFPLVEGNTYEIPPRSWHRVLRGPGRLKIEIQEGNTMRVTESHLRRIVREEILRESVYNTPGGKEIDEILPRDAAWDPTQEDGVIRITFDPATKPRQLAYALADLESKGFRVRSKYRAGALVEVPESILRNMR